MERIFPNWLIAACVGFIVGVLAWTGVGHFGMSSFRFGSLVFGAVGAASGGSVGAIGGRLLRLTACGAAIIGGIGFVLGFACPIFLRPDLPQGPLLGIFITGSWGAIVGAAIGFVAGLLNQRAIRA